MDDKKSALRIPGVILMVSLLLPCGCGGGANDNNSAQQLICAIFPIFCLSSAANSEVGQVLNGESALPPSDAISLISSTTDSRGNIYTAGYTVGPQDAPSANRDQDAIVLKRDADQNLLWFRRFGSSESERAEEILINSDRSVLAVIVKLYPMRDDPSRMERRIYGVLLSDNGEVLDCSELEIPNVP